MREVKNSRLTPRFTNGRLATVRGIRSLVLDYVQFEMLQRGMPVMTTENVYISSNNSYFKKTPHLNSKIQYLY